MRSMRMSRTEAANHGSRVVRSITATVTEAAVKEGKEVTATRSAPWGGRW